MTTLQNNAIENLLKASVKRRLSPFDDLPWEKSPSKDDFWLSPELISIYGQPEYESLSLQQRKHLSQLELRVCKILCKRTIPLGRWPHSP